MRPKTSTETVKFDLNKTLFWDVVSSKTEQNDTKQQQHVLTSRFHVWFSRIQVAIKPQRKEQTLLETYKPFIDTQKDRQKEHKLLIRHLLARLLYVKNFHSDAAILKNHFSQSASRKHPM